MPELHQAEARKLDQLVFGGGEPREGEAMTRSDERLTRRSGSKMVADTKPELLGVAERVVNVAFWTEGDNPGKIGIVRGLAT